MSLSLTLIQPTSKEKGPISIVLLRGPSDLAEEFQCIVNSIENTGSYSWNVPKDLEVDASHYGLKIIVDKTGDYQYSTQFGIKKGDNEKEEDQNTNSHKPPHTKSCSVKPCHPTHKPKNNDEKKEKQKEKEEKHKGKGEKQKEKEEQKQKEGQHPDNKDEEKPKGNEHPKSNEKNKNKELEHPSSQPFKYHNATATAHPTNPKSHGSASKTKSNTKTKTSKSNKNGASTSTKVEVVRPSASSPEKGAITSMVVASAPGEGTPPPPIVTAAAPPTPPEQPPNAAAGLRITGSLLAGVAVIVWFVL